MGYSIKTAPATFWRALTDFSSYRELSRGPLGHAFIYLLLLVLLPVLLYAGSGLYITNKLLTQITDSLRGKLPPMRIDRGIVIMDGTDSFEYETENNFLPVQWKAELANQVALQDPKLSAILNRRWRGDELTPAEENRISSFDLGTEWINENFPDKQKIITTSIVDQRLKELPPDNENVRDLLYKSSHSFNFFLRVDLAADNPEELPPGFGVVLGKDSYKFMAPYIPTQRIKFSEDTSEVINDDVIAGWRREIIWKIAPLSTGIILLVFYLIMLLVIVGGSAVAGLTASLLKCVLPFRRVFGLALYAVTPAIVFLMLYSVLLLLGFTDYLGLKNLLLVFLAVYGFYLISAARRCCSPA